MYKTAEVQSNQVCDAAKARPSALNSCRLLQCGGSVRYEVDTVVAVKNCCILVRDAVRSGRCVLMFLRNLLLPSSGSRLNHK